MESKDIFSVITISYNHGKFIEETLRSVIYQKGNFLLEYLILDGGSTDNTLEILERYKNLIDEGEIEINCKGIDFRYISEKDKGPTNALNKGLNLVKGEIIGILNSDDLYPPDVLESVWEEFKKNKEVEVLYGDIEFIDEKGVPISCKKGKNKLRVQDFFHENAIIQPEAFFKKDIIKKIGPFDENFQFANDYEFWIRCLKNKIKFKYIPYTLAIFRKRKDARSSGSNISIFIETLKIQKKYFGKTEQLLRNIGCYSARYAYEIKSSFEVTFDIFKTKLLQDGNFLTMQEIKKAKSIGYLKFSIYTIFENKKEGLKSYIKAIRNYPFIFFTKDNVIFILRIILFKKGLYFSIKNFIKS